MSEICHLPNCLHASWSHGGPALPGSHRGSQGIPSCDISGCTWANSIPTTAPAPKGLGTEALEASSVLPRVRESHFLLQSPLRGRHRVSPSHASVCVQSQASQEPDSLVEIFLFMSPGGQRGTYANQVPVAALESEVKCVNQFLNLGTRDIAAQIVLCHGACPVCCGMFRSILGLSPLDARRPPSPGVTIKKCLQTVPNVPWVQNRARLRTTGIN